MVDLTKPITRMKTRTVFGLLLCASAWAQDRPLTEFVFIAPGQHLLRTSPGTEVAAYGLGGGVDQILMSGPAGAVGLDASMEGVIFGTGPASNSLGIFTVGGDYHIPRIPRLGNFDFFAGAGYGLMFRTFGASGFDYGGGFSYWFPGRPWGLRVEFREEGARPPIEHYVHTGPYTHIWGVRIGFTHGRRPLNWND